MRLDEQAAFLSGAYFVLFVMILVFGLSKLMERLL